ncbi:MAG: poly[(R)-3-hydroxyalkanoate] polymerase subunit PhaC [Methylobacteriaceae bacterium]|jgi:polyhydroxyalkanoate synthase|nr:poly[(R)-3-hydroxyalkanoate] polymerase subunit PhaC [Methylobacteriaceae bacterium]
MAESQTPTDGLNYLQSLMQTGQELMQQFEHALAAQTAAAQAAMTQAGAATPWQSAAFFSPPGASAEPLAKMAEMQRRYAEQMGTLWNNKFLEPLVGERKPVAEPAKKDKRFRDEAWEEQPFFDLLKQSYLINAKFLRDFVDNADVDERTKMQLRFYARQYADAMSPANFPATNPEVIKTAIETRSESIANGMRNLIADLQKGRITRVDEGAFEVGRNLAMTPGSVVFENEFIQLIQYAPATSEIERTPLLMVPPCINKYYILDLQPGNSLVEYAVAQGHRVFLISWRSANQEIANLTWDDYLTRGIFQAMQVIAEITGEPKLHALGFCVGGTLLGSAAAVLAAHGDDKIASITLLTTMLDFVDTGDIGLIIDEPYVAAREALIGRGGILPGRELAFTFGTLRANDLIWPYVVNNYLKGERHDAFDLLYWDSDSVNLPGPMYCWYTRNTYLENNIKQPGKTIQCGTPVDLSKIKTPTYVLASKEDHIVPWKSAYQTTKLLGGDIRFVLGASGHVAGVINPPAKNKRSHWKNEGTVDAQTWFDNAEEHPGSWWPDWDAWLKKRGSGTIPAPEVGSGKYPAIEPAPGRYVKEKNN